MNTEFVGLDHIGIAVTDLVAATDTYRDTLGFTVRGGEVLEDRGLQVCFVDAGDTRIELIAPTREDSEVTKFLQSRGEGVHHICLRVADLDAALARMRARGAVLVGDGPRPGAHATRVAFLHPRGTHGVLIELAEAPAKLDRDP